MKKILFVLAISIALFSCSKESESPKFDTTKTINVKAYTLKLKSSTTPSASEVVRTVDAYDWQCDMAANEHYTPRGFLFNNDNDKDTVNNIIKLRHEFLFLNGEINKMFVNGYDFVFIRRIFNQKHNDLVRVDTIAYIPNSMFKKLRTIIEYNYPKGDYESCYAAMDTCCKFIPTTNSAYRELKKKGLN